MLFVAIRPEWAEPECVIEADVALDVTHWTVCAAKFAKALVVIRAIFLPSIASRCLMPVNTLLALETVSFLLEIATHWHLLCVIDVQVLAVLPSLTLSLEPVHTDYLLVL